MVDDPRAALDKYLRTAVSYLIYKSFMYRVLSNRELKI
jgi:hypothetical protein